FKMSSVHLSPSTSIARAIGHCASESSRRPVATYLSLPELAFRLQCTTRYAAATEGQGSTPSSVDGLQKTLRRMSGVDGGRCSVLHCGDGHSALGEQVDSVCISWRAARFPSQTCDKGLKLALVVMDLCGDGGAGGAELAVGVHPRAAAEIRLGEPLLEVVEYSQHPFLRAAHLLHVRSDSGHHRAVPAT